MFKNSCGLNFLLLGNNSSTEQFHLSPSQASIDDEVSMDSTNTGAELSDALNVAKDKQLISKALDIIAKVQSFNETDLPTLSNEEKCDYDGPVLEEQNISFNLQVPGPVPPYLHIHYICESGSRLLVLSIQWAKNIPPFHSLK